MSREENNDSILIREITPQSILSFGPETAPLVLGPLNIFIGPNGSGKSNFIDVIELLRATSGDIQTVIRKGGGISEWIWKGASPEKASLNIVVNLPQKYRSTGLNYKLSFCDLGGRFYIFGESIKPKELPTTSKDAWIYYNYDIEQDSPAILVNDEMMQLASDSISASNSILSQLNDPVFYPEISYLAGIFSRIQIFREWSFGRNTIFRKPQRADMRNDRLEEDFSNLGLYLSRLRKDGKTKKAIIDALGDLYSGFTDFEVIVEGGSVQVFFMEGDFSIPASRLSDGSLRYLILVALLCDPAQPR